MKSATELLAEMLKIYDEPEKGAGDLHSWLHQNVEDVRGVVEGGERDADEVTRLREFFQCMAHDVWGFGDLDGGDFHDYAVRQGLLVSVPADEDFEAEWGSDEMMVFSWSQLAIDRARGEGE